MTVDPRKLLHLHAIATEGTFGKAAAKLGMSQPALSLSIASLERALGVPLFERSRKGATLTHFGSSVLRSADALDVLVRNLHEEVRLRKAGLEGRLSIGVSPIGTMVVVPEALAMLRESSTNIKVDVRELSDQELEAKLTKGEIDIAIHPSGSGLSHMQVKQVPLFTDRLVLICSRHHPFGKWRTASLAKLAEAAFVLPEPRSMLAQSIHALFASAHISPPAQSMMCTSVPMIKRIVARSDYVAIVSDKVIETEIKAGTLKRVYIKEAGSRQICARLRIEQGNPALERFLSILLSASRAVRAKA